MSNIFITKNVLIIIKNSNQSYVGIIATHLLLKSHGVSSSFFGCITQTACLTKLKNLKDYSMFEGKTIFVDCASYTKIVKAEDPIFLTHEDPSVEHLSPKKRLEIANNRLCMYTYAKKIYTSRLHCFLPCRAMGIDVSYVGDNNYRVSDLINNSPDKEMLLNKFLHKINDTI